MENIIFGINVGQNPTLSHNVGQSSPISVGQKYVRLLKIDGVRLGTAHCPCKLPWWQSDGCLQNDYRHCRNWEAERKRSRSTGEGTPSLFLSSKI